MLLGTSRTLGVCLLVFASFWGIGCQNLVWLAGLHGGAVWGDLDATVTREETAMVVVPDEQVGEGQGQGKGPPPVTFVERDADLEPGFTAGARFGALVAGDAPIQAGLVVDASGSRMAFDDDDVPEDLELWMLSVSPLLMLRFIVRPSEVQPEGILQPYIAAGPAFLFTEVSNRHHEDDAAIGADARAGVQFPLWRQGNRSIGIFGEYRFTYHEPDIVLENPMLDADEEFVTHGILIGLGVFF